MRRGRAARSSAAAAIAASAPRHRRPEQPRERREQTLYAGVWWPPYHWPFQIVKPSCAEQLGAEGVRGEVDGARLPDQVDDREGQRDEHRRQRATSPRAGTTAHVVAIRPAAESGGYPGATSAECPEVAP